LIDICCNVNTINAKEGDDLKITMQITIGAAKVCHCADIYTGTERGVIGAGFNFIMVANDFARDCRIALVQTLGNICKTKSCILH